MLKTEKYLEAFVSAHAKHVWVFSTPSSSSCPSHKCRYASRPYANRFVLPRVKSLAHAYRRHISGGYLSADHTARKPAYMIQHTAALAVEFAPLSSGCPARSPQRHLSFNPPTTEGEFRENLISFVSLTRKFRTTRARPGRPLTHFLENSA